MLFWLRFFALVLLAATVSEPTTRQPVARPCGISLPAERSKGRASLQDWSAPTGGAVGHNAAPTR
jgi:hypothetical protein